MRPLRHAGSYADASRAVISPEWLLDVAVAAIMRKFVTADVKAASEHVGQVGDRLELRLTCEKVLGPFGEKFSMYGQSYIALMRDQAGNRVVYKGGRPPLGEGQEGTFKATVKDLSERDGEKQTVISRCKEVA